MTLPAFFASALSSVSRRALATLLAVLSLLVLVSTVHPSRASAGEYVVAQCNSSLGIGATAAGYGESWDVPTIKTFANCANPAVGMGVYEEGASTPNTAWGAWSWYAPPTTSFVRAEFAYDALNGSGFWPYALAGSTAQETLTRDSAWHPWQTRADQPPSFTAFRTFLQCYASPCQDSGQPRHIHIRNLWLTVQDDMPPSLALSGSLLDDGARHGPESLTVSTTDPGAGIERLIIAVNGVPAVQNSWRDYCSTTAGAATAMPPCPASLAPAYTLNTDAPPWRNGQNDLSVCATDFAGVSACATRTVVAENTCPASAGTPATAIDGGVEQAGDVRDSAAVRSDQQPTVRGRLVDEQGSPVSGATVCVFETVDLADASPELAAVVRTQPSGRFATALDAGPSRDLLFTYRFQNRVLSDEAALDATVAPTFRVEDRSVSNGSTGRFVGALPGPNAAGRAVVLQARAGHKWRAFKTVKTDQNGRFRGLYRFTQTTGTVRYVFRAAVKRQGGYPYEPGRSRKRTITVRG